MNDYTDIIETRGEYRVRIETMDHAEPPDWDGQGTVIQLDSDRSYVMHRTCDDFDLATLWRYWGDMALIERYLRMFHGVVGFDYFDDYVSTRGAKYVCIVTEANLREWGYEDLDHWERATYDHTRNPAEGILQAWQHWTEGEVYGYRIERRVEIETVMRDPATGGEIQRETSEDWTEVESCWGYYGEQDATEQAREAFSGYVSDTEGSVPA